jgi:chemotaxis protein CheX
MTSTNLHGNLQSTLAREIERATLSVFATMVGANLLREAYKSAAFDSHHRNVVSTVDLTGSIQGIAQVGYTLPLATYIACQMLQVDPPVAGADVLDALGEVANMIVGSMKAPLEGRLGRIQIGLPTVALHAAMSPFSPSLSVNFRCVEEIFTVSVTLQSDWTGRSTIDFE